MFSVADGNLTASGPAYIEDIFSAYTYDGNSSTQNIVTGNNLISKQALVWIKQTTSNGAAGTQDQYLFDTIRGTTKYLTLNASPCPAEATLADTLTAFNADGFTVGAATTERVNISGDKYVAWTFCKEFDFFYLTSFSHTNGAATNLNLSTFFPNTDLGFVTIKRTDSTGDWYTWHKDYNSIIANSNSRLNTGNSLSATNAYISVSGKTVTCSSSMPTGTYMIYAWAHDSTGDYWSYASSGTSDASGNGAIPSPWETQYGVAIANVSGNFQYAWDTARKWVTLGNDSRGTIIGSGGFSSSSDTGYPTTNGSSILTFALAGGVTYVTLAIRKGPQRTPTQGTDVFSINASTGTGATRTISGLSIIDYPDIVITKRRDSTSEWSWQDRLCGPTSQFSTSNALAGTTAADRITFFNPDGITMGASTVINTSAATYINYFIKMAPGFCNRIWRKGTGAATSFAHGLGGIPELVFAKNLDNNTFGTYIYYGDNTKAFVTNASIQTSSTYWNNTTPTSTLMYVGSSATTGGASNNDMVYYLFRSCPNVCKIGTYTGNGTSQNINCSFGSSARFVCIIEMSSYFNWYVFDSVRGIGSGNDPYLAMSLTSAETTGSNLIDTYSAGFAVNNNTVNTLGTTYFYWAMA